MLAQPFLRMLIAHASHLWGLRPIAIYADASLAAIQARTVVCLVAYRHECTTRDVRTAFGWQRLLSDYYYAAAEARHQKWSVDETYSQRIEKLRNYAEELQREVRAA